MTAPADFCQVAAAPGLPAGRLDPDRCSVQALVRGDSGVATASPAQRWLLVEQPGPWGVDALIQSRFDPAVAPRLAHRARVEGVRVLLVRRPGDRLVDSQRRWAYVDVLVSATGEIDEDDGALAEFGAEFHGTGDGVCGLERGRWRPRRVRGRVSRHRRRRVRTRSRG